MKHKLFTLLVALMASIWMVNAITIDGIAYYLDEENHTAEVTASDSYSGDIVIPEVVTYEDQDYLVTSIGDNAFGASGITSVIIPNSVLSIGVEAFAYNYSSLKSVTIGNSVTTIGSWAFAYNYALTSIVIPPSVISIDDYAFGDCSKLTSINIPETLTSIGSNVFVGCNALPVIDNIRYADTYLVRVVDQTLSTYTIQNGTRIIGYDAFNGCKSMTSILIPESVTGIEDYAFSGCTKLTSVTIPANVSYLGSAIFSKCETMESITIERETPATIYDNYYWGPFSGMNECPIYVLCGALEEYKQQWSIYTSLLSYKGLAFSISGQVNDENMGSVIVPENECNLQISAIPNEGYHFVKWSDGVVTNPRTIELTQDTTFTAEFALTTSGTCGKDNALSWVYQPSSAMLAIIGSGELTENYSFSLVAKTMKSLMLSDGITIIGEKAFKNSDNLETLILPSTLTEIGNAAFYECAKLAAVTLPSGIKRIGSAAFSGCNSIQSITIPESVEDLAAGSAFQNCMGLKSVIWNANTPIITPNAEGKRYAMFYGSNNITSFSFGSNVESIPYALCAGLSGVTEITIPESVQTIGESVFAECSGLSKLIVPASVTSIGELGFEECTGLDTLRILNGNATVGANSLYNCRNLRYVEAPASTFNTYNTNDSQWYSTKLGTVVVNGGYLNQTAFAQFELSAITIKTIDLTNTYFNDFREEQFSVYRKLSELHLPASLYVIDYAIAANAYYLKEITIPAYVLTIEDRAFENCRSLKSVTFAGNSLMRIGNWAFYNCHILENIDIPDGIEEIGDAAFYGCTYLQNVHLPASIQTLGDNAFALCSKLTKMDVEAIEPPTVEEKTFYEVSTESPVYVPNESVTKYKSHAVWGKLNIQGKHDSPTAINNTSASEKATKILRDGQILILRGEKVYTVTGQEVQ